MWIVMACLIIQEAAQAGPVGVVALESLGRFDRQQLPEASGIIRSRRHPGIYWVHNDSGNAPWLFAVRRDGSVVRRFRLAIPNVDWEDIGIDDAGHLYIGDLGNNTGLLRVRTIYQLDEPNPATPEDPARDRPLKPQRTLSYALPQGNRFDAEGLFVDRGRAVVVAKYLDRREAELFPVSLDGGERADGAPAAAPVRSLGRLAGFNEPATGADLSPDGTMLAVCSYAVTRVYRRADGGEKWEPMAEVRYAPRPIEGITWDGRDLVLAAEDGQGLFLLREARWRKGDAGAARARPEAARP
ncbi:MAG: hypothetical protein ACYC61_10255 [Isosphaeraceae bacterium]